MRRNQYFCIGRNFSCATDAWKTRYDAITTLRRPFRGPKHGSIDCAIVCMQLSGQTRRAPRNRHDQTPPPVAIGPAKPMDS
ncbi:hypothetical protein TgHK011_000829 [Trichoderma gracile]|nr:hypothetical protein TgHK011_000829 [Trichoderma gracile]